MSKVVLITGTSTGLGVSLAVKMAQTGATVYATMRNVEKRSVLDEAAKAANVEVIVKQLDVQNTQSVNACVNDIIKEQGHIDTLINNAGVGFVRTTEQASEEDIQWIMDVNFMGVVRCTKAVLPFMREKHSGHIINISSVGGLVGQPFNEIYCAAKFALEGYTESLAAYITPAFSINFTNVEPGGIESDFVANVMQHVEKTGGLLDDEYLPLLQKYMGSPRPEGIFQTADDVANVVVKCSLNDTPPLRTRTSPWSESFVQIKTSQDPTGIKQRDLIINQFLHYDK